jgi:rfaE bifunctional protein nucleotidyltransferase chain/domain
LHRGHIEYLAKAASKGCKLIVGLNTDDSVKRNKGEERPLNDQYSRALSLSALGFVAGVVLFDEDTPIEIIKKIKPDILVKGADYELENIVGADYVQAQGGKVEAIPLTEGYSTTELINKIKHT